MRKAFVETLVNIAKRDRRVFLLTGDLGYRILEPFSKKFPERFLNIGVAEANLVTVAAGLASAGKIPFVYSIATFMTMRPFEQIRNDVALQKMNVKLVGVGGGVAYGKAGATHHSLEDIAIMRSIPGMTIVSPADSLETNKATVAVFEHKGPVYLRLGRDDSMGKVTTGKFKIGKAFFINKAHKGDVAILAYGSQVVPAKEVVNLLQKKGITSTLVNYSSVKPFDNKILEKLAGRFKHFVTIEEHSIIGGLGSAVAEFLAGYPSGKKPDLVRFGLGDEFIRGSKNYSEILSHFELEPEKISKKILAHITNR